MATKIRTLPIRSFNKRDCKVSTVEGRTQVEVDMEYRMGLVVRAMAKAPKECDSPEALMNFLNRKQANKYSDVDMRSTLKKLRKAGIVSKANGWRLTPTGLARFQGAKIIKLNG
jgi:hypothetical protein